MNQPFLALIMPLTHGGDGGGPGGGGGFPSHPIALPPGFPSHPIAGPPGFPSHPIAGPPPVAGNLPVFPGAPSNPIAMPPAHGPLDWHAAWSPQYGWTVVALPSGQHQPPATPAPTADATAAPASTPPSG